MPRGRPKGRKDQVPRQPRRGSEASRILGRVLGVQAAGGGLSIGEQRTLTQHALREFEREQTARVRRLLDRAHWRVREARRQVQQEHATRAEAVVSFDVEVRSARGCAVYARPW